MFPLYTALGQVLSTTCLILSAIIDFIVVKWATFGNSDLHRIVAPISIFLVVLIAYRVFPWII